MDSITRAIHEAAMERLANNARASAKTCQDQLHELHQKFVTTTITDSRELNSSTLSKVVSMLLLEVGPVVTEEFITCLLTQRLDERYNPGPILRKHATRVINVVGNTSLLSDCPSELSVLVTTLSSQLSYTQVDGLFMFTMNFGARPIRAHRRTCHQHGECDVRS